VRCRRPLIATSIVAIAAASLLAAGCGSSSSHSSSPSSSSSSGGAPTQAQLQQDNQEVITFADCMRSHGVPSLPDPTSDPHAFKEALDPTTEQSPAFGSAMTTCHHLLPGGGTHSQPTPPSPAQTAALLAFARCLRGHGFPRFPDPGSTGDITHEMLASAGINLQQPAVVQAADACTSVTHGLLTRSDVARFVAGH
jgi:hypothetical protein